MPVKSALILIIDDDVSARQMLTTLLQQEGYDTFSAEGGEAGIAILESIIPDLILVDFMMPRMNGIELCHYIRNHLNIVDIPVVMVTAVDDPEVRLEAIEVGVDDFISKPYDMLELTVRVRSITNLSLMRRQRQEELRHERDRTQAILAALGEAVVVTNRKGIIEYVNSAACLLTGYAEAEMLGKLGDVWQAEKMPADIAIVIHQTLDAGKTWQGEAIQQHKDGRFYHAALTIAPIVDEKQPEMATGYVSVYRDITTLKEAQHLKEKFASNVSHELRTPLAVLTLLSGNLDMQYERLEAKKRREIVRNIRDQSRILKELIDSVLQLTRLDSQQTSLHQEVIDVGQILSEEIGKHQPLADKKQQTLSCNSQPSLFVYIHRGHLQQIMRNLITNAIKYTLDEGDIRGECVQFNANQHLPREWPGSHKLTAGNWVAFRIQDNGIGMSEEELPYIFGRFYRAHAGTTLPGAGLGLSIAQELIHLHGGQIFVQSQKNAGTTFVVYFPLYNGVPTKRRIVG